MLSIVQMAQKQEIADFIKTFWLSIVQMAQKDKEQK